MAKRSRKVAAGRVAVAKAKALPDDKSRSLSLKSRVGVIIILAAFILGGLYLALTGGSSTSFGNSSSDPVLELDYSWIQADPTTRRHPPRFRVLADRTIDTWRIVGSDHYSGTCNEDAFVQATSANELSSSKNPGIVKAPAQGSHIDYSFRGDDEGKHYCFKAVDYPERNNNQYVKGDDADTVRVYFVSPAIEFENPPEITISQSGNQLTASASRSAFRWRALRSDHWVADTECGGEAYGGVRAANEREGQSGSMSMTLELTSADDGYTYCFETLDHSGYFGYADTDSLTATPTTQENRILRYEYNVTARGHLTVLRTSGPAITGWQVIGVSSRSDCVTASFSDGRDKVADNSASSSESVAIEYEDDTDYCFKPIRTSGSTAPIYLSAQDIENAKPTEAVDKLEITEIRQITQQDTGTVVLQATTNRPVVGGVAIRGDQIGNGRCGINSFTQANEVHQRARSGDPFYITVTNADNGYEFCFKVEEVYDGKSYFATAVFKGGVNIPTSGTTNPPEPGTEPPDRVPPENPPQPPVTTGAPDSSPPSITVTHQESPAKLTARASEFVSTWRISGPYAAEQECGSGHFVSDFSLSNAIELSDADKGKWYCFAARDEAGNWGYIIERVPADDDQSEGNIEIEKMEDDEDAADDENEDDDENEADDENEDDEKDDSSKAADQTKSDDSDKSRVSDPGSGVSSLLLWIVVGGAVVVGIVVTVVVVTSLSNKPKF